MLKKYICFGLIIFLDQASAVRADYGANDFRSEDEIQAITLLKFSAANRPDRVYTMGINIDPIEGKIVKMFYKDNSDENNSKNFSIPELEKSPQILLQRKGYPVAKISFKRTAGSEMSGIFTIQYPKDVRDQERTQSKKLKVDCDGLPENIKCKIKDQETGQFIKKINIVLHYEMVAIFKIPVGIEYLETSFE